MQNTYNCTATLDYLCLCVTAVSVHLTLSLTCFLFHGTFHLIPIRCFLIILKKKKSSLSEYFLSKKGKHFKLLETVFRNFLFNNKYWHFQLLALGPPPQPVQGAALAHLCLCVRLHPLHHLHCPGQVDEEGQGALAHHIFFRMWVICYPHSAALSVKQVKL